MVPLPPDTLIRYIDCKLYTHVVFGVGYYKSIGIDESVLHNYQNCWDGFICLVNKGMKQHHLDQLFKDWSNKLDNKYAEHQRIGEFKRALRQSYVRTTQKMNDFIELHQQLEEGHRLLSPRPRVISRAFDKHSGTTFIFCSLHLSCMKNIMEKFLAVQFSSL